MAMNYDPYYDKDRMRYEKDRLRQEYEYRMQRMQDYGPTTDPAPEPAKPKKQPFLNPKLLLIKGPK
jgi:hypothetical protein